RVLEGASVRGLAGIPPVRGRVIRPLLEVRRRDLVAELERAGLGWVEDPSNRDPARLRNRVRHELLPRLAAGWDGDVVAALTRVAAQARAAVQGLETMALAELDRAGVSAPAAVVLPHARLSALPPAVAAEILRQAALRV